MKVSSGRVFSIEDESLVAIMLKNNSFEWRDEPFELSSGALSHFYISLREELTDNPSYEWLVGWKIAEVIKRKTDKRKNVCLIGVPTAGNVLAQAASMVGYREGIRVNLSCFRHKIMRGERKIHGANFPWIDGEPNQEYSYWLVDNVLTTGASVLEAADKLKESGYANLSLCVFIDRQQGGLENIRKAGCFEKIITVFNMLDIVFFWGEVNLWPKERVAAVRREIKSQQF